MSVTDDELHPAETARLQRAQETRPERLRFGLPDLEAEDLAASIGGDADRDDDRLRDHSPPNSCFAVGRVEEHVGIRRVREGPVTERGDVLVQVRADPRHLALANPGVCAERLHQVIDLPRAHAVDIRLHHDREQRLIHPPAAFQQRREEGALPQLRKPQLQVPRRRGQRAGAGAIALRDPLSAALEWRGADERSSFRVNQFLIESFGRDTDPVGDIGEFQFPEELEEGRLVKSHRAFVSSCE